MRRAGDRLRVTAQLIEAQTGLNMWADRYDGAIEGIFEMQDRITESVVGVIEPEIRLAEIEHSRRERPDSIASYDLYLRGLSEVNKESNEGLLASRDLFERALALEPTSALYMVYTAWTVRLGRAMGRLDEETINDGRVQRLCHAAVAAAPNDGEVLARAGLTLAHQGRKYAMAEALVARALETNPNSSVVRFCAGIVELHCGSLERSLVHLHRVLELSPRDPEAYRALTGLAHVLMVQGSFEAALHWAERSLTLNGNWTPTYWMLIAGNMLLGRTEAAASYLELFRAVSPGTTVATIRDGQPAKYADRNQHILEGLRQAGLPEA